MWPFSRTPSKADIQGHKTVRIAGSRFVIRKLNPLLDFEPEDMPQIFSSFVSRREADPAKMPEAAKKKQLDSIKMVVQAGLVEPRLVPVGKGDLRGKEDGVTVDDVFRDFDVGMRLYAEIVAHSLNVFKGVRGVFFSLRIRSILFTHYRKNLESLQLTSFSQTEATA